MIYGLTLLETGVVRELPMPPWAFGLVAFGLLLLLLFLTLALGKGRPHS